MGWHIDQKHSALIPEFTCVLACGRSHGAVITFTSVSSTDTSVRHEINLCMATSHVYMYSKS